MRKGILQKLGLPHHEYWPAYLILGPVWPIWIYYGIKAKCITYFTTINPSMKDADFRETSKMEILNLIPKQYKPTTVFVPYAQSFVEVVTNITNNNLSYPMVAKPDIGGMGRKVQIVHTQQELAHYHTNVDEAYMVQELVDYPLEFGLFYYHIPDTNEYGISSLVQKGFLHVIGDGKQNVAQLMEANQRANTQLERFRKDKNKLLEYTPAIGEQVDLEMIGNHCRGTQFIDARHLINDTMIANFHKISSSIPGFYYGRYDLKVPSIEDLRNGTNIKIMELNGMNTAPAHIYDANSRLRDAYKTLAYHAKLVYRIAKVQLAKGVKPTPLLELFKIF